MCFKCHKMGHYASYCFEKKKAKQQHKQFVGSVGPLARVDEFSSALETTFSIVLCLHANTI